MAMTYEQIKARWKREHVDGFLRAEDFEDGKPPAEHTHEEAARAIIRRGGWSAVRGFELLDIIGKGELKAQYVEEKLADFISPEYAEKCRVDLIAQHATHAEPVDWCLLCPNGGCKL